MAELAKYRAGPGAEVVKEVKAAIPEIGGLSLRPAPGPFPVVEVLPPQSSEVINTAAWAHNNSATTTLGASLEAEWKAWHQPVLESQCAHALPLRIGRHVHLLR